MATINSREDANLIHRGIYRRTINEHKLSRVTCLLLKKQHILYSTNKQISLINIIHTTKGVYLHFANIT